LASSSPSSGSPPSSGVSEKSANRSPTRGSSSLLIVRVQVERGRRARVPKQPLSVVDRHTVIDQPRRVRVPRIVEPETSDILAHDLSDRLALGPEDSRLLFATLVVPGSSVLSARRNLGSRACTSRSAG